jgi:hypothetical protein
VLGDLTGAFLGSTGEVDGEAVAAEAGYVASTLSEAGEALGLGALRRVSAAGAARASVAVLRAGQVIAARVEPARALAAVERAIDTAFQDRS